MLSVNEGYMAFVREAWASACDAMVTKPGYFEGDTTILAVKVSCKTLNLFHIFIF